MRSRTDARNSDHPQDQSDERKQRAISPDRDRAPGETLAESDESSELDEADLSDPIDDRWDVFILDDDECDPLPDYGDFWMPD